MLPFIVQDYRRVCWGLLNPTSYLPMFVNSFAVFCCFTIIKLIKFNLTIIWFDLKKCLRKFITFATIKLLIKNSCFYMEKNYWSKIVRLPHCRTLILQKKINWIRNFYGSITSLCLCFLLPFTFGFFAACMLKASWKLF